MSGTPSEPAPPPTPAPPALVKSRGLLGTWLTIRSPVPGWQAVLLGTACVALVFGAWWFVTRGEPEERIVSPAILPSLGETLDSFHELWFDRALTRNTYISLRRVLLG